MINGVDLMSEEETNQEKSETETVSVEAKTEEEKLTEFATSGLRGPKFGIYEQLLCQHLVQATVSSDPLRKIQLVVEGALMVSEEKRKALKIDMDKLEVVRSINEGFIHRTEISNKFYDCLVVVEFGFPETEENFKHYIQPWDGDSGLYHYPLRLAHHYSSLGTSYREFRCACCRNLVADDLEGRTGFDGEKCKFCGSDLKQNNYSNPFPCIIQHAFKKHESTPDWKMFFATCHALSQPGYSELKGFFLKWAMPFIMMLMNKLTRVVRPEIYSEILKMFVKARGETKSD